MRIAGKSPVVFSRRYIDSFMVGFFIVMLVFCLGCTSCWVTNYIPKARFEKCSNLITLPEKKTSYVFKAYNHYPYYRLGPVDDLEPSCMMFLTFRNFQIHVNILLMDKILHQLRER